MVSCNCLNIVLIIWLHYSGTAKHQLSPTNNFTLYMPSFFLSNSIFAKTDTDPSFPDPQFFTHDFSKPFRADRNCFGGLIFIYVRESIPSRLMRNYTLTNDIDALLEIYLKKKGG